MRHVARYRIYPSPDVETRLFTAFERCTFVRNWCLENNVFRDSCLPPLKKAFPELTDVHSKVLQNVVQQIAHNLYALKRMKVKGRKVGKLRKKRLHSISFAPIVPQGGFRDIRLCASDVIGWRAHPMRRF